MDLLYGFGDRLMGLDLVTPLVVAGSSLLVIAIALRVFREVPRPLPAAVGLVWVMWLTVGYFTPRPVLFSLVFLALFLLASEDRHLRWVLPLLMWVWSSVHGGFIVGLGYLVLDGLRRRDRGRLVDVIACGCVTMFTAHGWGAWEVVIDFVDNGASLDLIVEWLTPRLVSLEHFPFTLGLVAIMFGALKGRIKRADMWIIVPFLLFAFTANRSVPLSGLVLAPFFVRTLANWHLRGDVATRRQTLVNGLVLVAVLLVPWTLPLDGGLDHSLFAVDALKVTAEGPLFHDDAIGGYLIYSAWPDRQVYIDDRAELYEDRFVEFVETRAGLPIWRDVFAEFGIRQALLKTQDPLVQILDLAGWQELYRDDEFVVLAGTTS
jgi:hypothetical protein